MGLPFPLPLSSATPFVPKGFGSLTTESVDASKNGHRGNIEKVESQDCVFHPSCIVQYDSKASSHDHNHNVVDVEASLLSTVDLPPALPIIPHNALSCNEGFYDGFEQRKRFMNTFGADFSHKFIKSAVYMP